MLLFIPRFMHVRVAVDLVAVIVLVLVFDVVVLVGRVRVLVNRIPVLVLVLVGRFMRVLSHDVPHLQSD